MTDGGTNLTHYCLRHNHHSEVSLTAEELLNCISSAAATAQKASPAMRKPRVMAKPQASRFYEQEQARMRSQPKKRRLLPQDEAMSSQIQQASAAH